MIRRVAVTGGMGSGKSVVCRMLGMLGASVYNSDDRAKELMNTDSELRNELVAAFGSDCYLPDGTINRPWLAERVFGNREQLVLLNSIVHPAVGRDFDRWADEQLSKGAPYVVMESAILFESGLRGTVDMVVTVSAPEELRIKRSMARDKGDRESVERRLKAQMSDSRREGLSDRVIVNDERRLLWRQVLELDQFIRRS